MNIRELGEFTYEVQSEHRQLEWYRVDLCDDSDGLPHCDCPNFICVKREARREREASPYLPEGSCKHIMACLSRLNADQFAVIHKNRKP